MQTRWIIQGRSVIDGAGFQNVLENLHRQTNFGYVTTVVGNVRMA